MTGVEAGSHGQPSATGTRPAARDRASGHGAYGSRAPWSRARSGWRGLSSWTDVAVPVLPAALGLATGAYHLGTPPLWRDEAATKAIAGRSFGQILATMPHDDVVHCAYYLVVHVVITLFGSSDGALRLPSVLATAVACACTALVARRLRRGYRAGAAGGLAASGTGLLAGLVFALLPATIRYAQEARSYAIVTMMATVASYLLLRAVDAGGRHWWAAYGAAVFLTGLFNIFGLLLLAAHGLTLLATAVRRPERDGPGTGGAGRARPARLGTGRLGRRGTGPMPGWLAAGVIATALTLPVIILAYGQRDTLSWMASSVPIRRDVAALTRLWAGSPGLVWPVFGLAALGVVASVIAGRRNLTPGTVALPWLVVPPTVLLALSMAHPVYDQRYVEFCLPALAICVASGINWVGRLAAAGLGRSRLAWLAALPAIAAAAALAIALQPAEATVRQPGYRPDNLERESQIIAANAAAGDIVFYIPINDRIVSMPFPGPWRTLRDIALATSPVTSNTLYGTDVTPAELLKRFTHVTRVWVVSSSEVDSMHSPQATPLDQTEARLIGAMRQIRRWRDGDTELTLYAAR